MTDDQRRTCAANCGKPLARYDIYSIDATGLRRHPDCVPADTPRLRAMRDRIRELEAQLAEQQTWRQHFLRTTIEASEMVRAVRELHQTELFGGLPTGRCASCGELMPCPTRQLVPRKPDDEPCRCGPGCPYQWTTPDNPPTSTNTTDNLKESK